MNAFDYLRSPRARLTACWEAFHPPARLRPAVIVLGTVCAVAGASWCVQAYRLDDALRVQAIQQARYERSQTALTAENLYFASVRRIVELDRQVRGIAASGDDEALRLASIANALPEHTWLTAISRDGDGVVLEGKAPRLSVVGALLRNLAHATGLTAPALVGATAESRPGAGGDVAYSIRAGVPEP